MKIDDQMIWNAYDRLQSQRKTAEYLGISRSPVQDALARRMRGSGNADTPAYATPTDDIKRRSAKAKSFTDFRQRHDVDYVITQKCKELLVGDVYYEDHDFRELCGVASNRWRRHADSKDFETYRVFKPNKINAWASPALAAKMREVLDA